MNKILITIILLFAIIFSANSQTSNSALAKGSFLIEANTNFGAAHRSNTSISLYSEDDNSTWNIGFEGGYFVMNDLALKLGLGYGDSKQSDGRFSYKMGAKYYISSKFPVQADFNGSFGDDYSPLFLGLQGGYAWFVANNVAIEPGLRYDLDLNDDADNQAGISLNVGFSLYF
ncbi:hypothetical protein [Galbibacter mesophilus]|uniref:hypothetical protein n=1 Tax=Galbibacter mesophilus TaxID=379069 RepID=UPI00191D4A1E|nr:hypothetical protein [Galbibacter mesophilus]MCM5664422.1 hypothetical protein [Galbibacter mesophilus]